MENTEKFKVKILISQEAYKSGVKFGSQPVTIVWIKNGEYNQLTSDHKTP